MPYLVRWPLVLARDGAGLLQYFYAGMNPVIPWLSDVEAEHLVGLGAVELIEGAVDVEASAQDIERADRVADCAAALDSLAVPGSCGAPTARDALRREGLRFGNEVIAAAVKVRKGRSAPSAGAVLDTFGER